MSSNDSPKGEPYHEVASGSGVSDRRAWEGIRPVSRGGHRALEASTLRIRENDMLRAGGNSRQLGWGHAPLSQDTNGRRNAAALRSSGMGYQRGLKPTRKCDSDAAFSSMIPSPTFEAQGSHTVPAPKVDARPARYVLQAPVGSALTATYSAVGSGKSATNTGNLHF